MSKRARKSPPIPEVLNRLRGRKWQVAEGEKPKADLTTGVMTVPLDDSDASTWVRRHEMARLTWSPDAPITDPYEQAFEEARLNLLTKKLGLPTDTYREDAAVTATIANSMGDPASAALTRVALTATSDEAVANQTLAAVDPAITQAANEALTLLRKRPTFAGVKEAAAYLRERVALSRRPPKGAPRPEGEPGPGRPGNGDGKPIPGPTPKLVLPPMPKPPVPDKAKAKDDKPGKGEDKSREAKRREDAKAAETPIGVVQFMPKEGLTPHPFHLRPCGAARWGTMIVETPPLPLRLPRRVGKGKWRPADMGAVPRRMERWSVDQAVFSARGRQRAGTVLVDGSGSMGLSHAQILDVLLKAPAASVAVYSGGRYMLDDREITLQEWQGLTITDRVRAARVTTDLNGGRLQILVRRGRRVREIPPRGGANVVDGPALRWLARQKAPRVWVSDMQVTGVGENQTEGLIQQARDICRTFGIKVVPDVITAIRLLGGAKQRISKY